MAYNFPFDYQIEMKYGDSTFENRKAKRKAYFDKYSRKKMIVCVACNGSGRYDYNGSPKCSSCEGTGKVRED